MLRSKRKNLFEEGIEELKILVLRSVVDPDLALVGFRWWAGSTETERANRYIRRCSLHFRGCLNGGVWIGVIRVRNVKYVEMYRYRRFASVCTLSR